jgi:amidase
MKRQSLNRLTTVVLISLIAVFIIIKNNGITPGQFPYSEYSVIDLQTGYDAGDFTIKDVTKAYLKRIAKLNPGLNAMISVNPNAILTAKALDKELQEGKKRSPLHGIPIVLKDNIDTDDMPTTAGSRALEYSIPPKDAALVKQLRDAGAVILGKANLSEWANFRGELSSSGWSAVGGQTRNPYILDRNPCGSSSGSAVAVSANLCVLAIGTETNGSIVCPSHANGIVGIKPTVGLISRTGIIPISWTQDTAGPMARSVEDAALCLNAITAQDQTDQKTLQTTRKVQSDYTVFLDKNALNGKKIGYQTSYKGINYKVDALVDKAIAMMEAQGAEVIEIGQIRTDGTGDHSFQVMLYEYKDGLNKYFASLGPDAPVKSLEELIEFNKNDPVEMEFYDQAYLEMAQEKEDLDSEAYLNELLKMIAGSRENGIDLVMDKYGLDAIIAPTGTPAWKTDHINGDAFQFGSSSPAAQAGYPNITVPMGFIDGLPVGISFFGRAWSEDVLIGIAYAYEQATKVRQIPEFKEQ